MTAPRTFRSLDLVYSIDATTDTWRALLFELLADLQCDDDPQLSCSVEQATDGRTVVRIGGDVVVTTANASLALAHLLWEINHRAVNRSKSRRLLVHASAVQDGERAILFAGPSGSGKSTIAAALVNAGMTYLTDDVVVLDPVDDTVVPYPKPLGLDHAIVRRFPSLAERPDTWRAFMGDDWYVTPAMLGGRSGVGAAPRLVVFPTYSPAGDNEPVRISRADALVQLAENSFNFMDAAPASVGALASTLRTASCFRIAYSDVDRVVEFVTHWFAAASSPAANHAVPLR